MDCAIWNFCTGSTVLTEQGETKFARELPMFSHCMLRHTDSLQWKKEQHAGAWLLQMEVAEELSSSLMSIVLILTICSDDVPSSSRL